MNPQSLVRNVLLLAIAAAILAGCRHAPGPVSLSGEDPVSASDFIDFFTQLKLPYQVSDTTLLKKAGEKNSLRISQKIFLSFFPDTVLEVLFGKKARIELYAVGKAEAPGSETYVLIKAVRGNKKALLLGAFSKKHQLIAAMPVLFPDDLVVTRQHCLMDRKFTITRVLQRKNKDGSYSEGKDVYALDSEKGQFILIMTDALEDKPQTLVNPIDTLPALHKWSGDYSRGTFNLVSIRDGRRLGRLRFFIHFDKGNKCRGELKGEASIRSSTVAEYNEGGDPCKLRFIFNASSVQLKEIEGCGSYRPHACSFDGLFPKKRNKKTATRKNGI